MEPQIQEEITNVEESTTNEQLALFSLQEMAITATRSLEQIREDLKTTKEMIDEAYKKNEEYVTREQELLDANKEVKAVKYHLDRTPEILSLQDKAKELKAEAKAKKSSLSDYVMEVFRQTGETEFQKDGERYEIKTVAKLVKI